MRLLLSLVSALAFSSDRLVDATFRGKIKRVRIKRPRSGGYRVSATVAGPATDVASVDSLEVVFEEPFEGPTPQENPLTVSATKSGWGLATDAAVDGVNNDIATEFKLSITPVTDDGKELEGAHAVTVQGPLGAGANVVDAANDATPPRVSWGQGPEPDVFFDIFYDVYSLNLNGADDEECPGCLNVELALSECSLSVLGDDDSSAGPGSLLIKGEATDGSGTTFTTLLNLPATPAGFWTFDELEFDDDPVGMPYTITTTMRNADGKTLGEPVTVENVVAEGSSGDDSDDSDDDAPQDTRVVEGTLDGTLNVGPCEVVRVTGTVTGAVVVTGGTVRFDGSVVKGSVTGSAGGTMEVGKHEQAGDVVIEGR